MARDLETSPAPEHPHVTDAVREHYAEAAARAMSCGCGPKREGGSTFGAAVYLAADLAKLPVRAVISSLGCGNPTAVADLREGEVVLDLGSGGGIDVLLSARRVGPSGKAYGLDMTDEMLTLARANQAQAGVTTQFLEGRIEAVPLPDASVDVILSNCVINLSQDKETVLAEAFRVLRRGGRLAIADVVIRDPEPGEPEPPNALHRDQTLWSGCFAGALPAAEYRRQLAAAGFADITIEEVRRYTLQDLAAWQNGAGLTGAWGDHFISAIVRARKPHGTVRLGAAIPRAGGREGGG